MGGPAPRCCMARLPRRRSSSRAGVGSRFLGRCSNRSRSAAARACIWQTVIWKCGRRARTARRPLAGRQGSGARADAMNLDDLRREYTERGLRGEDLAADPFTQFGVWFDEVARANVREPNAMTLATATLDGRPSARMVLLKGLDARG